MKQKYVKFDIESDDGETGDVTSSDQPAAELPAGDPGPATPPRHQPVTAPAQAGATVRKSSRPRITAPQFQARMHGKSHM